MKLSIYPENFPIYVSEVIIYYSKQLEISLSFIIFRQLCKFNNLNYGKII